MGPLCPRQLPLPGSPVGDSENLPGLLAPCNTAAVSRFPGNDAGPVRGGPGLRSHSDPSGIRTRVTAVRGRRTRPLYDGAVRCPRGTTEESWLIPGIGIMRPEVADHRLAGVPGLEPRMTVPETVVLPITPYPTDVSRAYLDVSAVQLSAFPGLPGNEKELYTAFPVDAKSIPAAGNQAASAPSPSIHQVRSEASHAGPCIAASPAAGVCPGTGRRSHTGTSPAA